MLGKSGKARVWLSRRSINRRILDASDEPNARQVMPRQTEFRIVVGVDGSAHARAALATVLEGPWPDSTRVHVVVAKQTRLPHRRSVLLSALDRSAEDAAAQARRTLAPRWPDATFIVVNKAPVAAIVGEAERVGADLLVVGWRGHGPARRLLMGSVSRGVIRKAKSSVLVVRRRPRGPIRNLVLAFDEGPSARRAVSLVGRLSPTAGGRVTIFHAVQLLVPTSRGPLVAGIRASVSRELRRINTERSSQARKALQRVAREINRRGWRTRIALTTGEPLRDLMDTIGRSKADLVIVGARGTRMVRHMLLGSVAEGALNLSPVPVLLTR